MNDEQFSARTSEILSKESTEPEAWWWLSFCDGALPTGEQFLGACLVKARGFLSATIEAKRLECNPGGEVQGVCVPIDAPIPEKWKNRLLTKAEALSFDREMGE